MRKKWMNRKLGRKGGDGARVSGFGSGGRMLGWKEEWMKNWRNIAILIKRKLFIVKTKQNNRYQKYYHKISALKELRGYMEKWAQYEGDIIKKINLV